MGTPFPPHYTPGQALNMIQTQCGSALTIVLGQFDEVVGRPLIPAIQQHTVCTARAGRLQVAMLDSCVDCIDGHRPVGCPLATLSASVLSTTCQL